MPAGLYATPVGVNVAPSLITVAPYRTFSKTHSLLVLDIWQRYNSGEKPDALLLMCQPCKE